MHSAVLASPIKGWPMPFTETGKITLEAAQAVELYKGVMLPPGSYPGIKAQACESALDSGVTWSPIRYRIELHRKTACQYGCNRPAQSEFGRDRRDGICTLGTVEANLRRPSLALLLPVGSGYMCCDAHPPRSCAVAGTIGSGSLVCWGRMGPARWRAHTALRICRHHRRCVFLAVGWCWSYGARFLQRQPRV